MNCPRSGCRGRLLRDADGEMRCHLCNRSPVVEDNYRRCFVCERPSYRRGYCNTHYQRLRRLGTTEARVHPTKDERFWSFVNKTETCWLWTGSLGTNTGYGIFRDGTRTIGAHRYLLGVIPKGMQVDHLCRVRQCVRPDHLEIVTQRVNILRGQGPSAIRARATHCVNGHELTAENVYHRKENGHRQCRQCKRDRDNARAKARRETLLVTGVSADQRARA